MKAWRLVIVLSLLLLSGCLVTFKDPIPAHDSAPAQLLGTWTSKNAWGEPLELEIKRAGNNQYRALSYRKGDRKHGDEYRFTVVRHGSRWYLSAGLPEKYGSGFVMAGFELAENDELVVYNLDLDHFRQWTGQKLLDGQTLETEKGEGVLISSPLATVFGYLDDPANSDVFLEVARYQRLSK
ncbi:MAG TPA: hypothetical protein VF682_21615 [Pseudomonas sp.]